ncbi:MAG TPA: TSUP family transporter, partial [Methylomirabilota bacterium]|nr:TSUP family transporter [Methylomirabilota bacterium]
HFPAVGAAVGFLSAVVVTTGPVLTPFVLAYGLRRGAFIATEAWCAFGMHVTRGVVLARFALLTWPAVAVGLVLGVTMFAGSWIGRRLVDRLTERAFVAVVEALLVLLGLQMLLFPR